jgi:hypothetical protein
MFQSFYLSMVYVQPQFRKVGQMKGNTFKANHGAQVHKRLRHAVIVDSQTAHDINKIMVWGIKFKQCFIILRVNALGGKKHTSKLHSWKYEYTVLFMYPPVTAQNATIMLLMEGTAF